MRIKLSNFAISKCEFYNFEKKILNMLIYSMVVLFRLKYATFPYLVTVYVPRNQNKTLDAEVLF